ncbi:NADPH oxidase 4-like [Ruditapes philippinarum]|uniref:NADPH oxidase 4-like n=1 Tax=Ruditapes philippinarum TaxID=129788 RepID=UPI00295BFF7E|nr:NADPH oxidase 4-like [Ruditapes philippinarum]
MNSQFGKCYNQGFKYFTRVIWCVVSGLLFWRTYEHYRTGLEYVYLHEILGTWLCLARGSAAVLNLNCAVVLLPMCHTLVWLLNRVVRRVTVNTRWLKMETKSFHIFIGYVILLTTGVHVAAHVVNINSFCENFHEEFLEVNPFSYKPKIYSIVFGTVTGVTGILMTLILLMIFLTSLKVVRRRCFNTFWYSHRIFVVFYLLFVFHGFRGPLRKQINVDKHIPGCHRNRIDETMVIITSNTTDNSSIYISNETCSEMPTFVPIGCHTWLWVGIPVLIYICDVVCRIFRRRHSAEISDVRHICDDIIEVSFYNSDLKPRPGQYVFVNCNQISTIEWHPFSVVQVPTICNNNIFKLWIKSSGDWTDQFVEKTKGTKSGSCCEDPMQRYPTVQIDGPYSSSMENILKYKFALCIAGGVGITPFLSHILYLAEDRGKNKKIKLKCLHLIFAGRNEDILQSSFETIQKSCEKVNGRVDIDVKLFYTGKLTKNKNAVTSAKIQNGRPQLGQIFKNMSAKTTFANKRCTVGVFACGPVAMCTDVARYCNTYSTLHTRYAFHKESF